MRYTLPLAVVLAASVVVALAWDGPAADSCPPVEVQPVSAHSVELAQVFFDDAAVGATKWVCVELGANSFSIRYGDKSADLTRCDQSPLAYILCDRASATSGIGETSSLTCTNCRLVMPDGTTAEAPEATYDSDTGKLTLSGFDDLSVRVTMASGGAITTMKAPRMELEIKPAKHRDQTVSARNPLAANF